MPIPKKEKELLFNTEWYRPTAFICPKCGANIRERVIHNTGTPIRLHCVNCPFEIRRVIKRRRTTNNVN